MPAILSPVFAVMRPLGVIGMCMSLSHLVPIAISLYYGDGALRAFVISMLLNFVVALIAFLATRSARRLSQIVELKAAVPTLDVADRRRWEVHGAAQRVSVAVALKKRPPRAHALIAVGVDPHHQFGIARL